MFDFVDDISFGFCDSDRFRDGGMSVFNADAEGFFGED